VRQRASGAGAAGAEARGRSCPSFWEGTVASRFHVSTVSAGAGASGRGSTSETGASQSGSEVTGLGSAIAAELFPEIVDASLDAGDGPKGVYAGSWLGGWPVWPNQESSQTHRPLGAGVLS
jgi:hypothetical protein